MKHAWCPACKQPRLVVARGADLVYTLRTHKSAHPPREGFAERVALNKVCPRSATLVSADDVQDVFEASGQVPG